MKSFKTLGLTLTTTAFLAGCGASAPEAGNAREPLAKAGRALQGGNKKPVVEPTTTAPSACTALYSSPQAQAALTQAVVDPSLAADGLVKTLILSFNTQEAVAPAVDLLQSTLGLSLGDNLGAFKALPMVALKVPVTPVLMGTLRTVLQPLGLLSIYQDRPLHYFLDQSVAYIGADTARTAYNTTGAGVGVGIIDSGVDGTHGDFPNLVKNVKVVAPIVEAGVGGALYLDVPNSDLTSGHGTHVASTIGGSGAKSGGKYKGVAPGANLIAVGTGEAISILYSLEGFDFLMDPDLRETYNLRVISNSWGSSGSHFAPFDPVSIASKRAYDEGVVVAFAAGNDGPGADTLNPYSASPCVISVAAGAAKDTSTATNPLITPGLPGELASFSSRGIPGDALHHPDITLPGVAIVAARATTATIAQPYLGLDGLHPEPFYAAIDGTSMATPHLSGLIALMLEVNPALNLDGVLAAITSTAKPMFVQDATTGTTRQLALWEAGAGYADAYAAVRKATESAGTRTTTVTTALPGWSGNVGLTVKLPVLDVTLVEASHTHNLAVPAGANALRITTDWGNPALDLDLFVYDPSGNLVASSANGTSTGESVSIPRPAAGTWRVQLKGFLNTPTSYTGTAQVDTLVPVTQ
ncbi:serine protease AprX [Archangium gephyra]|uniref:Secreted peptidase n=1 Tax=Archangium gephyra TaxID=48 RepID=A0AAC8Q2G1_9BACT|nr:S8 family serine peptidase [Archangium gephyra]AKI99683.1 putative secreted peptidase [Archangium gephyra]REG27786.1 serine protease AprX [Archangium gephyra]